MNTETNDLQKLAELQTEKPLPGTILKGYTSIDRPFKVDDYPYGFRLRTSIHYWIESKAGHGDRLGTYTINPKNGRRNSPKYSTYSTFMYLYINEKGHVDTGTIDSYHKDVFQGRFYFILGKIGEEYITDIQKQNLRINHAAHVKAAAPYEAVKYSEEKKPEFINWVKATLKHILTCDFKDLVDYPDAPEQDNPEGEVRMVTVERKEPEQPKELTHTITEDKVKKYFRKSIAGVSCRR